MRSPKTPKILKILAFLAPKFYEGLNQNSANKISAKFSYLVTLKFYAKILKNAEVVGKTRTEILAILRVILT